MIGYKVLLKQLEKVGSTQGSAPTNLKSELCSLVIDLYNAMGDAISMQYGSSAAHHKQINNNKNKNFMN